jgi:hypothetical protein
MRGDKMPVQRTLELFYGKNGDPTAVYRKVPKKMARIHDKFLDCAISVYPDEFHAAIDAPAGGSGFLVGVPGFGTGWLLEGACPQPNRYHIYAVTNRHVVSGRSSHPLSNPSIRLNLKSGGTKTLDHTSGEWIAVDTSDLAIKPIGWDNDFEVMFVSLDGDDLLVRQDDDAKPRYIGVGDEVFMVSRFIDRPEQIRNAPIVRLGTHCLKSMQGFV